jgi:hypothetical protein
MQETLIMGGPNVAIGHVSRRANGTWLDHEHSAVASIYRRAQRITGFNLRSAEDWQVSHLYIYLIIICSSYSATNPVATTFHTMIIWMYHRIEVIMTVGCVILVIVLQLCLSLSNELQAVVQPYFLIYI